MRIYMKYRKSNILKFISYRLLNIQKRQYNNKFGTTEIMNASSFLPIGFIGSGNMSCGIMNGLIQSNIINPSNIIASKSRFSEKLNLKECGVQFYTNNEVALKSKTIVIGVKPHLVEEVLTQLDLSNVDLIVSVAAGITLKKLENILGNKSVIRVMPNTAVSIGEGCAAMAPSHNCTANQIEFCKYVFTSVCKCCVEISEANIDSMIGISGSGIAYMYIVAEAMIDAGVKMGLPRNCATELVSQTMVGAGKMIQQSNLHPMVLKDQVTSPGGTTICGVAKCEELGLRNVLIQASEASCNKAKDMAKLMP